MRNICACAQAPLGFMVKSFLGSPATSAGLERAFTGAGKMHDDFKKNAEEKTLKAEMKVVYNIK